MSDFKPSQPIGPTDEPDSPILDSAPDSTESERTAAPVTCTYDFQSYGEGARICMTGKIHECTNRGWVSTGKSCP